MDRTIGVAVVLLAWRGADEVVDAVAVAADSGLGVDFDSAEAGPVAGVVGFMMDMGREFGNEAADDAGCGL